MAGDTIDTVAAINAAAAAISSTDLRYTSPDQRRWKSWWSAFWCFGSQKRDKQVVPTSRLDGTAGSSRGWTAMGLTQAGLALAPPSSPASFVNSSVQSPSSFTLSLSAASTNMCSPGPTSTMFTIGPYAHETQLVSPPVFSTFTTEPSTAPFTPPPELAHLTTPSSPDVPFAQLLASSLEAKASARETSLPFSPSPLASPADIPGGDLENRYQFYPGSPVVHLISPTSGISGSVPDIEFPARLSVSLRDPVPSFPNFELFASTFDSKASCATFPSPQNLNLLAQQNLSNSETNGFRFGPDFHLDYSSDPDIKGETGMTLQMMDLDDRHTNPNGINRHAPRNGVPRSAGTQEKLLRDKEVLDAFSLNGTAETDWQIHHIDHSKEVDEMSWHKEGFCAYIAEAALAKREHIHEKWMQQASDVMGGNNKFFVEGFPQFTAQTCSVSGLPKVTGRIAMDDSFSSRTGSGEHSTDLHTSSQESQRLDEAVQVSAFDTMWPVFGLRCHQGNSDVELVESPKPCICNVKATGCRRCGELPIRCSELKGIAAKSPDRNLARVAQ